MSEEPASESRRIDGLVEYEHAIDELLARPCRTLRIFDRRLSTQWNSVERQQRLRELLLASRTHRVRILLHDTSTLRRDCPRIADLLRTFAHAVSIHETDEQTKRVYDPFVVIDEQDYLHRFHYDDNRALLAFDDMSNARTLVQRFEEIWETSAPAVTGTTLGL